MGWGGHCAVDVDAIVRITSLQGYPGCRGGGGWHTYCGRSRHDRSVLVDEEVPDLLEDQLRKVRGDDFIRVAVSRNETIAVGDTELSHRPSVLWRDRGRLEAAEVEEYHDLRSCDELGQELREDGRSSLASLVEEDAKTVDLRDLTTTEPVGQDEFAITIAGFGHKVAGREAILDFRLPLLLLAEAPEDEDAGENCRQNNGEPCALGDFGQRRGQVGAVQASDREPEREDEERIEAPHDDGGERDHAAVKEGYKHNAHAICVTEASRVGVDGCDEDGADHEQPVDQRDVELPMKGFGSMHDLDLGKVGELHDLGQEL